MNDIDLMTVRQMMYNDPCTEEEFYIMYKDTDLFKRKRAWNKCVQSFNSDFKWLFDLIDRLIGA